ncbi:MAG TPA: AAA family ATPase, partial [Candidatus Sulfotelmatobacter sp.]|nr:AAA family ATPase [Candidatus Sulfotelmatobacter sp.]
MTPENPFTPLPTPESILETLGFTEALRRLGENLGAREPFLLITGEPGMGKTTLAQLAIARWGSRAAVARLAMPLHTGVELLEEILHRLGAEFPESASRPKLAARLELLLGETVVRQQVAVIVVDDAHHLSSELLEELRLLVSAAQQAGCRIEVLLLGPPALEERLEQPALAPLRQRVSVRAHLAPLSAGEARRYIRHRLAAAGLDGAKIFPRKTCAEIAAQSCGVPREINALAAEALRVARAAGSAAVEPSHVREALATLSGALPKGDAEDAAEIAETVAEALVVVKSEPRKTAAAAAPPSAVFAVPPPAPAAPGAPAPAAPAVTPTPAPPVAKAAAARVEVPVAKASATPVSAPVAKASATPADPPVARPAPAATVPPPGDPSRVRDSVPGDEEFSKPTPAPPANYTPS